MRVAALVSGFGWHIEDLRRASGILAVEFLPVEFSTLNGHVGRCGRMVESSGNELSTMDGVLVRMMPPAGLEPVVFRMDTLYRIERAGTLCLNSPRAVEVSVDKYLSLALIEHAGLSVPPTFAGELAVDALKAFEELGGDVVVKPLFGSEGRGLVRLSDRETAWRVFHALERIGSVLYVQKTIRHPGFDYRAFVLGGRVVAAMKRHGPPGDWRTNVAIGGRPEAMQLDPSLEQLAIQAAAAVGAEMAGVDLLDDLDLGRPVVIEVNAVPGWKALSRVTGKDIALSVLEHLKELGR